MKRILKVNTSLCDARGVREEVLTAYDEVKLNCSLLVVSAAAKVLMQKCGVKVNTATTLETEENVVLATVNGVSTLRAGDQASTVRRFLVVNGVLEVEPGAEEQIKSLAGLVVNGVVTCPESMAGLFSGATLNGKLNTYPDGCIRLKSTVVLDKTFALRARQGGFYYAAGRVVALDCGTDFTALAEKGVTFQTRELLVCEALAEQAVPLFDEQTEITILPDGCAYVDDDAELNASLLRRYGNKLYVNGDLTVSESARGLLEQVAFLKVNGDVNVTRSMQDAVAGMKWDYKELTVTADVVLKERDSVTVDCALLERAGSLDIESCEEVLFAEEVPADWIGEKLLHIRCCEDVVCSKAQRAAVELIVQGVDQIWENAEYEGRDSATEDTTDTAVTTINAATYTF